MNGTRLNTNSVQVKLKINCKFIVNNAMWLQKNKKELKTWDETPIHVIPNVMVIQVLQCKLSPSSYIVGNSRGKLLRRSRFKVARGLSRSSFRSPEASREVVWESREALAIGIWIARGLWRSNFAKWRSPEPLATLKRLRERPLATLKRLRQRSFPRLSETVLTVDLHSD